MGDDTTKIIETNRRLTQHGMDKACSDCALRHSCLPQSLTDLSDLHIFEKVVEGNYAIEEDELLAHQGTPFDYLFVIKSGTLKSYDANNSKIIHGFYFPGQFIGLESIGARKFASSVQALDRSVVCALDYEKLTSLLGRIPSVKHHFIEALSNQYQEHLKLFSVIRSGTVQQRVSAFLLHISGQYNRRRLSSKDFVLPMSRSDIANFLGVSSESLSRTLTMMSRKKHIKVFNRRVTILNHQALGGVPR